MNKIVLRTNKGEYSPGEEICGSVCFSRSAALLVKYSLASKFDSIVQSSGPKVPDAYSGQPIYSILQGIQLELLLGRTRSDECG